MRRDVTLRLLAILTPLAGCAEPEGSRGPESAWAGGQYALTASPASQPCGDAIVTFTSGSAYFFVTSGGTGAVAWLEGGDGSNPWGLGWAAGTLSGRHFELQSELTEQRSAPCPPTGATTIVTTTKNHWHGDAADTSFESVLAQEIADDCGVVGPCAITWSIHGDAVP